MSRLFCQLEFESEDECEHNSEAETISIDSSDSSESEEELERREIGTQVTYRNFPRKKRSIPVTVRRMYTTRSQIKKNGENLTKEEHSLINENGEPNSVFDPEENYNFEMMNEEERDEEVSEGDQQARNENTSSQEVLLNSEASGDPELTQQVESEPETQQVESEPETRQVESEPETQLVESEPETRQVESEPETRQVENDNAANLVPGNSVAETETNNLQSISFTESRTSQTPKKSNDLTVNISGMLEDGTSVQPLSICIHRDSDLETINISLNGSLSVQRANPEKELPAVTLAVPTTSYQGHESLNLTNDSWNAKMDDTKLSSSTVKNQCRAKQASPKEKKKKKAPKNKKKGKKHLSRRRYSSSSSYTSSSSFSSDYETSACCCSCRCGRTSSDSSSEYSSSSSSEEELVPRRKSKVSSKKLNGQK